LIGFVSRSPSCGFQSVRDSYLPRLEPGDEALFEICAALLWRAEALGCRLDPIRTCT
jgi:hypothetical protein